MLFWVNCRHKLNPGKHSQVSSLVLSSVWLHYCTSRRHVLLFDSECMCVQTVLAAIWNIIEWWWDGKHISWAMENSCSISHFLSFSLATSSLSSIFHHPSISVQTFCPLSPLNTQWCLSASSLLGLSNTQGWHTNKSPHTHMRTYKYSLFWPGPLGWVNISIIYHKSPTTHSGRPAEGWSKLLPQ